MPLIPRKLLRHPHSPDDLLGELFVRVQKEQIFDDGKTFVDMVPIGDSKFIIEAYELENMDPDFDLSDFVARHFYEMSSVEPKLPAGSGREYPSPDDSMTQHIAKLWPTMMRRTRKTHGSLIALPHPYIVPGGRFQEQFYWDSYFIMLGLSADGRWDDVTDMLKNFEYMLNRFGFIPTGNRTYFLTRSQPPFFSHMVRLLADREGAAVWLKFLPSLLNEYKFWMRGSRHLVADETSVYARVVGLPSGDLLGRYFDQSKRPRPESFREDASIKGEVENEVYLHLRAAAESGWDFSSRWLDEPDDLTTIRTADILPVDLNCLLYDLEKSIAETYAKMKLPLLGRKFLKAAERRAAAIERYFWHHDDGFYYDYDWVQRRQTRRATLAAVFPLWSRLASDEQAQRVAERLRRDFLANGGLKTTLVESGQQWDAPNGWAPLIWVAVQGLRNYGINDLANEIKNRWLAINEKVYRETGKMIEKYNIVDENALGGGGEYPLQDGFGWTNGVAQAFLAEGKS